MSCRGKNTQTVRVCVAYWRTHMHTRRHALACTDGLSTFLCVWVDGNVCMRWSHAPLCVRDRDVCCGTSVCGRRMGGISNRMLIAGMVKANGLGLRWFSVGLDSSPDTRSALVVWSRLSCSAFHPFGIAGMLVFAYAVHGEWGWWVLFAHHHRHHATPRQDGLAWMRCLWFVLCANASCGLAGTSSMENGYVRLRRRQRRRRYLAKWLIVEKYTQKQEHTHSI